MKLFFFICSVLVMIFGYIAYEEFAETKEQQIIMKAVFYLGLIVFMFGYFIK